MTKYTVESMTEDSYLQLIDGWTPYTLASLAVVSSCAADAWLFDSMTEATLALFTIERECPKMCAGKNFIVVPVAFRDPQEYFRL